ncbi:MAG: glycosyltransferase family 4 protein [Chloroflexi bacterium]|nr:glycosyltransferase family 4 protein [Chloroflexota bacterium]
MVDSSPRVGLNAQLLNLSGNYRSAGISWYIYYLLKQLETDQRFAYTVFLNDPRASADFIKLQLARTRLPTRNPLVRILWEQLFLSRALARARVDLFHALAFAAPRVNSIPSIVTIYDLSFLHFPQSFNAVNRVYLRWAVSDALRRAQAVIAISESTKRDLVARYGISSDRVRVIYCGKADGFTPTRDEASLAQWRAARGLPARLILSVGTLEPRKNAITLLRAFARAKRAGHLPHQLVLIGARGWKYENIARVIEEEGLGADVRWAGYVPQNELGNWYRAAEIFVYPSLYEGFGLPPLEAMACGTPVIASNISSLPEVVGDAARLIDPQNIAMLADAMIEVARDANLKMELRARGLIQAEKFSWQRMGNETVRLYQQILAKERA